MSLISFSMSGRLLFLVASSRSKSSSLPDAGPEGGVEARRLTPRGFRMSGRRNHFVATTIQRKMVNRQKPRKPSGRSKKVSNSEQDKVNILYCQQCCGSRIQSFLNPGIQVPGWEKIWIRDEHPRSLFR
jgi:hypothetical protein